jgi:galactose mutarotase-like enzyme
MHVRLPFFRRTPEPMPRPEDFGTVELRGGDARVVIIPSLGGKIAELHLTGKQWLWASDVIPLGRNTGETSYVELADSGGYDECFPTVGACRIPGWVRTFGGVELPDHGELWSQNTDVSIRTTPEGQCAITTWVGERLPYRFQRTVQLTPGGAVRFLYDLENTGSEKFPWIWSAHPSLPLTEETRISIAEGAPLRVLVGHGIDLGESSSTHRWPYIRAGGKVLDFTAPWDLGKRYACKLFVDMVHGSASVREGNFELSVRFQTDEVTHLGIWINKRGWTPFHDRTPALNIAFEPAIGAPDMLSEALGAWDSAAWLEPGQHRRWSLEWRGRKIPSAIDEATTANGSP